MRTDAALSERDLRIRLEGAVEVLERAMLEAPRLLERPPEEVARFAGRWTEVCEAVEKVELQGQFAELTKRFTRCAFRVKRGPSLVPFVLALALFDAEALATRHGFGWWPAASVDVHWDDNEVVFSFGDDRVRYSESGEQFSSLEEPTALARSYRAARERPSP